MDDAEQFKQEREEKFGGKIGFMTYTRYMGSADDGEMSNRGGILFLIGDTFHFEDFESQSPLMAMMGKKEKYSKTEFALELSKISIAKEVREKSANQCVMGSLDKNEIQPAPRGILSLFGKIVTQILLDDGTSLFMDFMDKEGFLKVVNDFMLKPE